MHEILTAYPNLTPRLLVIAVFGLMFAVIGLVPDGTDDDE